MHPSNKATTPGSLNRKESALNQDINDKDDDIINILEVERMEGAYKTQLDRNLLFMRQYHAEQIQNLTKIIR